MDFRELHIEKGHLEQLKRHNEALHPLLDKTTVIDLNRVIDLKIAEIVSQIKHYKEAR